MNAIKIASAEFGGVAVTTVLLADSMLGEYEKTWTTESGYWKAANRAKYGAIAKPEWIPVTLNHAQTFTVWGSPIDALAIMRKLKRAISPAEYQALLSKRAEAKYTKA